MKNIKTILTKLESTCITLNNKTVSTLNQVKYNGYTYIIIETLDNINTAFNPIINAELDEFEELYNENQPLNNKKFINELYSYNYDFHLNDLLDAIKTIDSLLTGNFEQLHYLKSNVYTMIVSYIRIEILTLLSLNIVNNTKPFSITQYKQLLKNKIANIKSQLELK